MLYWLSAGVYADARRRRTPATAFQKARLEENGEGQTVASSPTCIQLFLSFLRLGLTAFGGPAMIAYIRRMAVEQKNWLDPAAFQSGVALCQTIPGATAMQMAAYVGLRARGTIGAAISFIGFGLPAFLMMTLLSALYVQAHDLPPVLSAFRGLQVIIVALIANAAVSFGKTSLLHWKHWLIAGLAAAAFVAGINPLLVIALASLLGIVLRLESHASRSPAILVSTWRAVVGIVLAAVLGYLLLFLVNRSLFELSILMLRIDLFAFGGGFASVPLMFHEIVDVRGWMDGATFLNGIALGQVTPGPIVITSTFVGYWLNAFPGAVLATVSIFLPSFLMVIGVAPYLDALRQSSLFNRVMAGILSSFVGLLVSVTIRFAMPIPWDPIRLLLVASAFLALWRKIDVLWVVFLGTALSLLLL